MWSKTRFKCTGNLLRWGFLKVAPGVKIAASRRLVFFSASIFTPNFNGQNSIEFLKVKL